MPRAKDSDEDILKEAKARFERCVGWESAWRTRALFDTRFANGDSQNGWQWYSNAGTMTDRGDRPTLTYNQVRQHNLQVINDARQNKAQIKVTPVGGHASYEAAQVFSGIIRRIEYVSKAVDAYSTATYHQVESGLGYVRVDTDYIDGNSFDLDLFIRRVANPLSIYMDPDAKEYDKSDSGFAFVFEDIPRDRYEEEYGKEDNVAPATLEHSDGWNDKDHVRIAEYWRRNLNNETLHRLQDGTVVRDSEIPAELRDQVKALIVQSRDVAEPEIEWFKLAGDKIIDREQWLGKYIPIVPFIGEETVIEGEMDRKGHTRAQIDAQRIYNYWAPLALHTPLPTPAGWTTMGEVREGDFLLDEQGHPTLVSGLSPVFLFRQCHRVTFDDGSSIIADAGHPWQVEERGKAIAGGWKWDTKVVSTKELTPTKHFIRMPEPLDLPDVDLPIDPYLLGVWLGDGTAAGARITGKTDIDEFRQHLAEVGCRLSPVHKDGAFSVYDVWDRFVRLGLAGNKHIPEVYLRASARQRWALLQGLMDTDGSANLKVRTCTFYTGNSRLSDGFAELLSTLGLKSIRLSRVAARRKFPDGNIRDCLAYDQFTFSAPPDVQVFRLRRKRAVQEHARVTHWRRTRRFRIKSIEAVPSEPVRCVHVEAASHLFLAGPSMVPTHNSAAVEQVALQTKTPYVARADAIEGRTEQWATANVKNWSVLVYNGLDEAGNPIPPPARNDPPAMAQAYIQGMSIARDDLRSVTGQYQAEMGMPGNERSGRAIDARQRQSDVATYHYVDNQAKGIRQIGRILLDLIPKVYDTRRVVMMLAEDGTENKAMIAPDLPDAHQYIGQQPNGAPPGPISPAEAQKQQEDPATPDPAIIFNPQVGTYDVEADVGPAYGTQRQEAANAFSQIMQQNPAAFQIVGDFWAANSDFPNADELAERLKRGLPPQYKAGPDPQVMAVTQQAQQMQQQAQDMLGKADAEIASLKAQLVHAQEAAKDKSAEIEIKDYQAETDRLKAVGQIDPLSLQAIVRQMVADMLGTEIHPVLQQHAANESELQATLAPPVPVNGADGQAPSGPAPGGATA
jgi:hypothetical protein